MVRTPLFVENETETLKLLSGMESGETEKVQPPNRAFRAERNFIEVLVWVIGIFGFYWAVSVNVAARNFNTKTLVVPMAGECRMMEMLVFGTSLLLPLTLALVHLLYWEYQTVARRSPEKGLHLPSFVGSARAPTRYRNYVAIALAGVVLVLPMVSYVDLVFQLQKYCQIVPRRVVNQSKESIAAASPLSGARLFLFPLKRPGVGTDAKLNGEFYWINSYPEEWLPRVGTGKAKRLKVSAVWGQPFLILAFGVGLVISTGMLIYRARGAGPGSPPGGSVE